MSLRMAWEDEADDDLCNIRIHFARCSVCHCPLVAEIEYVLGKFYAVMLMIAACPMLWRTMAEHPFEWDMATVDARCLACRECRAVLAAYAGRPLPRGGAVRALYTAFATRYSSAKAHMALVRSEVQAWGAVEAQADGAAGGA
jgi:hypothetical protein